MVDASVLVVCDLEEVKHLFGLPVLRVVAFQLEYRHRLVLAVVVPRTHLLSNRQLVELQ